MAPTDGSFHSPPVAKGIKMPAAVVSYDEDLGDGFTCLNVVTEQDRKSLLDYMYKYYMQGG